ncbi:NUDIX domain-containing protein [Streptomyces sp. NPDC003077]|uniref:NUDIX domain-containing protein n=1 Tax=Streptomyces sp. NPDC003077 TaxID=3154443 RepID=UPI0033B76550
MDDHVECPPETPDGRDHAGRTLAHRRFAYGLVPLQAGGEPRFLVVRTADSEHFDLPGGEAGEGEPDWTAMVRTVFQQTGLSVLPRKLISKDWSSPGPERPAHDLYIYDCIPPAAASDIIPLRTQPGAQPVVEHRWATAAQLRWCCREDVHNRVQAALTVAHRGHRIAELASGLPLYPGRPAAAVSPSYSICAGPGDHPGAPVVYANPYPEDPHREFRSSFGVLRDEKQRVLLVRSVGAARYRLPGGVAVENESPRTALHRCVQREVRLCPPEVVARRLVALNWNPIEWKHRQYARLDLVYDCGFIPASTVSAHRGVTAYRWASCDELSQFCGLVPGLVSKAAVEVIINGLPPAELQQGLPHGQGGER